MHLIVTEDKKFLRISEATEIELEQIAYSLKKRIRGHFFSPLVKKKLWDGYVHFCKNNFIPIGLWGEVIRLGETYNFPVSIDGLDRIIDTDFDEKDFRDWVEEFFSDHPKYKPRDYQIESAAAVIKHRLCTSEIATSAGKTLITFLVYGYLKTRGKMRKMVTIVPNTSLVMQMKDDWEDYNNGKLEMYIRQVYGGAKDNDPKADVVVGTFQSLTKKTLDYYKGVDVVFVDECLHPDSLVRMSDGSQKEIKDVKIGDIVETVNQHSGEIQSKEVDYVYENLSGEEMYEIETDDGRILRLTGNHKVLTKALVWKRVDQLTENDELFEINKKNSSYYD
jgi:hypothetical protein